MNKRTIDIIPPDKLKDTLIKGAAEKTGKSEDIIEKVINFAFSDAKDAAKEYGEVEISGFGKFIISNAKITRKMRRFLDIEEAYILRMKDGDDLSERKQEQLIHRLGLARETIEHLKSRMR